VPLHVLAAVDSFLIAAATITAAIPLPEWIYLLALIPGAAVIIVYGHRAAAMRGIRSVEETPRTQLMVMALPSGLISVTALHTGRYAGLVITAYLLLLQGWERAVWRRFESTRPTPPTTAADSQVASS